MHIRERAIRWIFITAASLTFLLAVAWMTLIATAERRESYGGPLAPSCGEQVDRTYVKAVEMARDQVQAVRAERQIPGISVAIAVRGRIVWSEGIGFADMERRVPACPDTLFRTASIAKTFTAAAMARLAERG